MTARNLDRAILHTLAYADVFDYPLNTHEIHRYLWGERASLKEVESDLMHAGVAVKMGEYFVILGRAEIIAVRQERARLARRLWPEAIRYGYLLGSLPFARMVAVTGSLAVNNVERGGDIDYMIVTAPGFVWTCRALCLVVTRIARLRGVHLCPNYLVSEDAIELTERSYYAARELAQMVPLTGMEVYGRMRRLNGWTQAYVPNADGAPESAYLTGETRKPARFQAFLESILRILPTAVFERFEMKRKIRRLRCEQAGSAEAYFSADVCKGHLDEHGGRIESELARRLKALMAELPSNPVGPEG